jgi:shikimate 5-dehydrogenase
MMNNDNSITAETKLYGFIGEEAHKSHFSSSINKLFKANNINAMVIPMNIRPDDLVFTISQMRSSKLSGAVISTEFQEMAFTLLDHSLVDGSREGVCDLIQIVDGLLVGDFIAQRALEKYANDFDDNIAMQSMGRYFYELITGELK